MTTRRQKYFKEQEKNKRLQSEEFLKKITEKNEASPVLVDTSGAIKYNISIKANGAFKIDYPDGLSNMDILACITMVRNIMRNFYSAEKEISMRKPKPSFAYSETVLNKHKHGAEQLNLHVDKLLSTILTDLKKPKLSEMKPVGNNFSSPQLTSDNDKQSITNGNDSIQERTGEWQNTDRPSNLPEATNKPD
jgi:hypothetical protein